MNSNAQKVSKASRPATKKAAIAAKPVQQEKKAAAAAAVNTASAKPSSNAPVSEESIYEDLSGLDTLLTVVLLNYSKILCEQTPDSRGYQYYEYLHDARLAISELARKCDQPEYHRRRSELAPFLEERLHLFELIIEYAVAMGFKHTKPTQYMFESKRLSRGFLEDALKSTTGGVFDYCAAAVRDGRNTERIKIMLHERDRFLTESNLEPLTGGHPLMGTMSLLVRSSPRFMSDRLAKAAAKTPVAFNTKEWLLLYTTIAFQAYRKSWEQGGGGMIQLESCLLSHSAWHSSRSTVEPNQLKAMVDFLLSAMVQCDTLEMFCKKYMESLSEKSLNERLGTFIRESLALLPNPVYLRPDLKHISKLVLTNSLGRIPSVGKDRASSVLNNIMRGI